MTDMTVEHAMQLADLLYRAGYDARHKERDYDPRGCGAWQDVVEALTASSVPEGWKLVPMEPSVGMWDSAETAMIESELAYDAGEPSARSDAHGFPTMRIWQAVVGYRAMLAAAPEAVREKEEGK